VLSDTIILNVIMLNAVRQSGIMLSVKVHACMHPNTAYFSASLCYYNCKFHLHNAFWHSPTDKLLWDA